MFKRISSSQKPEQHSVFDRYVKVTKPGIIMGNLISVAGGYFLAARGDIDWVLMLVTIIGL